MSKREQNLLSLLLLVAVLAGALLTYNRFYIPSLKNAQRQLEEAQQKIALAESYQSTADLLQDEQDWLARYEPNETTQQAAQSALQARCERLAQSSSLTIKTQTPREPIAIDGRHYHRARMDMTVSGMEANFYRWITELNDPTKFNKVTFARIYPKKDDDTQIEAKVIIEQWYRPQEL